MLDTRSLIDEVLELVLASDEDAAWSALSGRSHHAGQARVDLIEDVCRDDEALSYAVVLAQLGRVAEAREVVSALITAVCGVVGVPLGSQRPAHALS